MRGTVLCRAIPRVQEVYTGTEVKICANWPLFISYTREANQG